MAKTFSEGDPVSFEDNDGETVEGTISRVLEGDVYLVETEQGTRGVPVDSLRAMKKRSTAKED